MVCGWHSAYRITRLMDTDMSKILITGATGLVGSACVGYFANDGWDVVALDNNMRSHFFATPDKTIENPIDIRDVEKLEEGFKQFGPFDAIIHAAAQPSHDYATTHIIEDFEINTRGTLNLLEATRKYSPNATFIFVSTDKVYGENMYSMDHEPFAENLGLDFAGLRSFFGCSKTAADIYVQEYGNRYGMKTACFRPGCITGKNHEGAEQHGFLAYLSKCIKEGKTYKIFGDGRTVRDQIHANDLASAFWHFINAPRIAEVYNIGGGPNRSMSILEAGKKLSKKIGKPFNYEFHPERKGDRRWDIHQVGKFRQHYPEWNYQYSLQDIINDVCEK